MKNSRHIYIRKAQASRSQRCHITLYLCNKRELHFPKDFKIHMCSKREIRFVSDLFAFIIELFTDFHWVAMK